MESPENERKLKKIKSDKQRRNSSKRTSKRSSRERLLTAPIEDFLPCLDEDSPTMIRRADDDTSVPFIKCISSDSINTNKGEKNRTRRATSLHRTREAVPHDNKNGRDFALSLVSSSSSSSATSMSIDSTTTPPHSGGRGGSIYPLLTASNGANETWSRERLKYTPHKDGLLNENETLFDDVDFCFRCDPPVTLARPDEELMRCTEKTGYKLNPDDCTHIPVYRTVFLCAECMVWLKEAKKTDNVVSLKISPRALAYFSHPKVT